MSFATFLDATVVNHVGICDLQTDLVRQRGCEDSPKEIEISISEKNEGMWEYRRSLPSKNVQFNIF